MSISSEILRIQGNVADAYTAANAKGATMPVTQNSANLASTISTIQTGTTPTGTIQITTNGTHDVTNYATADIQVPTTAPAHYIDKAVNANGKLIGGSTIMSFSGATDVGNYTMYYAYYNNTNISGAVDMSDLIQITGQYGCSYTFNGCTGITSVDLSSLTTISGSQACSYMFQSCTGIINVDLTSLTLVSGSYACRNMFKSGTGITSLDLSLLTIVSGSMACMGMFSDCTSLTSVDLSNLAAISGSSGCQSMFESCTSLTTLSFPALRMVYNNSVFTDMLWGTTGVTVHFPSNMSSYNFNVGGTNTTVLYDLPATLILTGADAVTYTRNPKYDTGTALAWKVGMYNTMNFTPAYYTSGLTDPTVGTTIYSDAACTTVVTTVATVA